MLDQSQLDHMRERQDLSLMDTCHRLVYTETTNDYNEVIKTWPENTTDIKCGLEQKQGQEVQADKNTVVSYDAIIRLPLLTAFDIKDKIRITKRFGEAITPIDYEIASPIQRGPSGIRLLLKDVTI